ncbi:hypothetical protein [Trinickia dinghuensis]|uniref:DUF2502 domain-containing protein n=1 Tax=Trinickia dinghuensis TaxID=2291023 RepID=A0A3D8JW52_9BURK|nr:hypothetical protein [Trinickia dinghuensis]RDU96836.1 hypothetical protein DWV00_21455 [Trinickia dinghuensis]
MKSANNKPRSILIAIVAASALVGASSAFAQYAPEPTQPAYAQAHMIPVDVSISLGWHGDRYWDGHRYWDHDDWMRRHPHAHDPHHDRDYHADRDHHPDPDHRY